MSSIVISELNQESILTDLSDEQINTIQGGGGLGLFVATVIVVAAAAATTTYLAGYTDGANSCKIEK